MKTTFLLTALLATTSALPSFAREQTFSHLPGDPVLTLDQETLDYLASRTRVSVGMDRGTVIEQMGAPGVMIHRDIWAFTGFRASNVFGAERYDTLIVVFKDNKVAKITLTAEKTVRAIASARPARTP